MMDKNKKWRASIIIESSIVLPFVLMVTIWMLQIGILIYDSNTMELVVKEQVKLNLLAGKEWSASLQSALEKRMFHAKPISITQVDKEVYLVEMKIGWFWRNKTKVILPRDSKQLFYHFVNGKQLIDHIPLLQEARDKYFEELEKIIKD